MSLGYLTECRSSSSSHKLLKTAYAPYATATNPNTTNIDAIKLVQVAITSSFVTKLWPWPCDCLALALSNMALALMAVLGLGFKDNICGLGLVGEKQNFNIICRLYEFIGLSEVQSN